MNALRILREVTGIEPWVLSSLEVDKELIEKEDKTLWVDNDHPWDVGIAHELLKHGGRFVVADELGGFVAGPYRDLRKVEQARASAKMTVQAFVEVEDDEPEATADPKGSGGGKKVA